MSGPPVELDRGTADRLAEQELAHPDYHRDDPGIAERVLGWAFDRLDDLFGLLGTAGGGLAWPALVVLLVILAVVVVVIRMRVGPVARSSDDQALFEGRVQTADEHRRAADAYAASGQWRLAARERLRATVRGLEERGLLDERPGRTADEAATEAGRALPASAAALQRAARVFDEVYYGGRSADAGTDSLLREVEQQVRRDRPAPLTQAPRW